MKTLGIVAGLTIALVLIGAAGGLFIWRPTFAPATLMAAALFPAWGEEYAFRHRLTPRPGSSRPMSAVAWRCGLSLAAFVAWHPLQYVLGAPWTSAAFLDPVFWICAGLLGGICMTLHRRTRRLWPAVAAHWGAVAIWKSLLGG